MAKTLIKTNGTGVVQLLPDSGEATLRFTFRDREDAVSAFGEITGFIDALIDAEDGIFLVSEESEDSVQIEPIGGGRVDAFFDLFLNFEVGEAELVESWLEESGLIDEDLVELSVVNVDWEWDELSLELASTQARLEATVRSIVAAGDYATLLTAGVGSAQLRSIHEFASDVSYPCSHHDDYDELTLVEALTPRQMASAVIELEGIYVIEAAKVKKSKKRSKKTSKGK